MCLRFDSRQDASAFNQPLSFDTSSVTDMAYMFWVRSSPCPAPNLQSSHLPCTLLAPRSPATSRLLARIPPRTVCLRFDSRQYARAFNQPLSFDTSRVTNMAYMFDVRSSRALCSTSAVEPSPARCVHRGRLPHPASRAAPPTASYALPATRQAANSLSNANKLLIRCAWAGTSAFSGPYPGGGYAFPSWGLTSCVFTTKASLKTAVRAYNANPTATFATSGPIAKWDVSAITDMSFLFYGLNKFNADISNWDTSGVTNMDRLFNVSSTPVLSPICSRASTAHWTPSPPSAGPHPAPHRMPPF